MSSEEPVNITEFPPEIREKIWNKLDPYSAVKARRVCRQFRADVDTLYNFWVKFRKGKSHPAKILELRIAKLTISSCTNLLQLPVPKTRTTLLKYPQALKHLHINTLDSDLSPENSKIFQDLITASANTLTSLGLWVKPSQLTKFFGAPSAWSFENLKKLELCLMNFLPNGLGQCQGVDNTSLLIQFMRETKISKIRKINIDLTQIWTRERLEVQRILESILIFIGNHWRTLEEICVLVDNLWDMEAETSISEDFRDNLKELRKVTNLRKLEISDRINTIKEIWPSLILNQKGLRTLKLDKLGNGMSETSYSQTISNNFSSLVEVEIGDIHYKIDLNIFSSCQNLKSLTLFRGDGDRNNNQPDLPDLVNLPNLPPQIEKLDFFGFNILSLDILAYLSCTDKLQYLKQFTALKAGTSGLMGVNEKILNCILSLENGFSLNFFCSEVNISNALEWAETKARLNRLGWQNNDRDPERISILLLKPPGGPWRVR